MLELSDTLFYRLQKRTLPETNRAKRWLFKTNLEEGKSTVVLRLYSCHFSRTQSRLVNPRLIDGYDLKFLDTMPSTV